jgi:IMP dehydrogenase
MVREVKEAGAIVGAACGPFDMERAQALIEAGVDVLVIDCAHGHNTKVVAHTKEMRHAFPHTYIIAGNIATEEAARDLSLHVNAVKVGIGPGSICTTRIVSGVGVPQITAIMEVANGCKETGALVIADGGIRTPGDVAKALAAGAHLVMLGSVLACTHEAPGKTFEREGIPYKEYRGMGSRVVLEERKSDDRYLQKNRAILPEGIEASTRVCGPLADVIEEFTGGLQVAMGYVGARSLDEFRERAKLIRITDAGVRESRPHSVHALG